MKDQTDRAAAFRELHRKGGLILPNAWDAVSARLFQEAGCPAVGTTSCGVAWARGRTDGEGMTRDEMAAEIAVVARGLSIPLSADMEAGYGPTEADVAATAKAAWDAGAVGINLEDADHAAPGTLFGLEAQQHRLAAARAAAPDLVINARTDVFLLGVGEAGAAREALAIERGRAWLEAGADVVFAPGVTDPGTVRRLAEGIGGPLSLMAGPAAPPPDELFAAGACRISVGPNAMLAAMTRLKQAARVLAEGRPFADLGPLDASFAELDVLFA